MAKVAETKETVLLLMGKTGYGKSATGTSILGWTEAFKSSCNSTACSSILDDQKFTRYKGQEIRVVDTPGLCDTGMSSEKCLLMICESMSKALVLCHYGFDVLLFVLRFGDRFTDEDKYVVSCLKKIFGSSIFRERGVVVFTHGEQLDLISKVKEKDLSFEKWLARQESGLKSLVSDCKGRAVLFRNMTPDVYDAQRDKLMTLASGIESQNGRYHSGVVAKVKEERDKVVSKMRHFWLNNDCQKRISLLQDSFSKLERRRLFSASKDPNKLIKELDQIREDAIALKNELKDCDAKPGEVSKFHQAVVSMEHEVLHLKSKVKSSKELDDKSKAGLETSMKDIGTWLDRNGPAEPTNAAMGALIMNVLGIVSKLAKVSECPGEL